MINLEFNEIIKLEKKIKKEKDENKNDVPGEMVK